MLMRSSFLSQQKGEKYRKEGWEDIYTYGFWGCIILTTIAWNLLPDTR